MQCGDEWSFVDWRFPVFLSSIPSCFIPGASFEECHPTKEERLRLTETDGRSLTRDRFWAVVVKEFGGKIFWEAIQ